MGPLMCARTARQASGSCSATPRGPSGVCPAALPRAAERAQGSRQWRGEGRFSWLLSGARV
eukprot:5275298-Pyramimonas_sp.AAC.1